MKLEAEVRNKILRDTALSVALYAAPVLAMWAWFSISGERPWDQSHEEIVSATRNTWRSIFRDMNAWGLTLFMLVLGTVEFLIGLYDHEWDRNEKLLDLACFTVPRFVTKPFTAYFGLLALPVLMPGMKSAFDWVPFWWGFAIVAVGDDLTQYWYHRLHHQLPWLWRFHRTHHSAPYMGMAMSSRQNLWYTIFFSQAYLTIALTYVGLGEPAIFVLAIKSLITTTAHSAIPWDRPFYRYRILHPIAWVLERLISTPATHHAHHADVTDDGVGYYKGNFGNMFFLWDVIFGTGLITRQYPASYGISHYEKDQWYAQLLWPVFKSRVAGSELASDGPVVREDIPRVSVLTEEPSVPA